MTRTAILRCHEFAVKRQAEGLELGGPCGRRSAQAVLRQKRVRIAWQQLARFLGTSAPTRSDMDFRVGRSVWEEWWAEGRIVTGVALVAGAGWTMRDQAACRT
jgi:hypothetical protein